MSNMNELQGGEVLFNFKILFKINFATEVKNVKLIIL